MAGRAAQLAIELTEKGAADAASSLDRVSDSARRMGDTVDSASKQVDQAGSRLDSTAEGADELASKGSQAAGAMGGLGELIGGPFGAAMQTGGVGLQAMADSGDLLNAALENSVVQSARAKAATIGKTIADKASTVATKAMTVAQKALNLAQRASPLGAIIFALGLLVGAVILAYKKSDTFRRIVDAAMRVAKAGVDKVVDAFRALGPVVQKIMSFVAKVVGTYVRAYVAAFQLGLRLATAAWNGIRNVVSSVVGFVTDKATGMRDKVTGAWETIKRVGVGAFEAVRDKIQDLLDLVDNVVDKISNIHLPSLPHIPGLNRTATLPTGVLGVPTAGDTVTLAVTVNPAAGTTPAQAASQAQATMDAIDSRLRAVGRRPVFAR